MHTNLSLLPHGLPGAWRWPVALLAALMVALGLTATAQAAPPPQAACTLDGNTLTCQLWARVGSFTPSGSPNPIDIWGYADNASGIITLPGGPTIVATEGMNVEITLNNDLPGAEMTSLALHGQGQPADRVGAAPGGSVTYTFVAGRPGTFLYEAGMTPNGARQVAMGLYGALIVRPALGGQAYATPESQYDDETVLILSEVDPALNAAPTTFDMQNYQPRYWLINGQAYPDADSLAARNGRTLLLRYLNAGLNENSMALLGIDQNVIAADGYALPFSHRAVAETLPAGGTLDALISVPAAAAIGSQYTLYSAAQHLDNDGAALGGQLLFLNVTDGVGPTASDASAAPNLVNGSVDVVVSASLSDVASGNSNLDAAEYFIDTVGGEGNGTALAGTFSGPTDNVTASLPAATLATLTPGTHTVYIRGLDANNNWGAPTTVIFTLDPMAPTASNGSITPTLDGSVDVTINAEVSDAATGNSNVDAAEYFIDAPGADGNGQPMAGAFGTPAVTVSYTILAIDVASALPAGTHMIYVHGRDAAGNWGGSYLEISYIR